MDEIVTNVSDDGAVALPDRMRRLLGIKTGDAVSVSVRDDGSLVLRPVRFPTVASLVGAAGSLPCPRPWPEMRAIAYEERLGSEARDDG